MSQLKVGIRLVPPLRLLVSSLLLLLLQTLTTTTTLAFSTVDRFSSLLIPPRQPIQFQTTAWQTNPAKLSELPSGISPFEKGASQASLSNSNKNENNLELQFRLAATRALEQARRDGKRLLEIEFPPLLFKKKTQFDDFDNIQELDLNRDWCIEWLPSLSTSKMLQPLKRKDKDKANSSVEVWFLLPDLKECELAKQEWQGKRYRGAATFTTIEAVTRHYCNTDKGESKDYQKPWGATLANSMSNLLQGGRGGGGWLGDFGALDELKGSPDIHVICQPGNGGPVEDWINCEILHNNGEEEDGTTTVIVNGALDKVRDGYYPAIFFPALAATVDRFYKKFESIFYLRPLSDKGCYGWVYRVYPEPWQVILQTKVLKNNKAVVENKVVYTSNTRPSFALALEKMIQASPTR